MFAVIKTGGKQYKVAPDDVLKVERLPGEAGETVVFDNVLMVGSEGDATVGSPAVEGASVAAEILDQGKERTVIIFKKRRRQNSRRRNGHRQLYTSVKISEILTGGAKPSAKAAAAKAAPAKAKAEEAPAAEAAPSADAAAAPLFTAPEGEKDDLKKISGVGPKLEEKLNNLGITTYAQVAAFTAEDIERVDAVLNFKGRIEREDWVAQAKTLSAGDDKPADSE